MSLKITGRVQGVFFRASTKDEAQRLSLTGEVWNTEDGGVEIIAEGPPEKLDLLAQWCKKGPPGSRVDKVGISRSPATRAYASFRIRY